MGDSNSIFEAGQSLVEMLKNGLTPEPIASREAIGLCSPHEPEDYQLTVWIYNFETVNETGMNQGFSADPYNSGIERFAPIQLRLHVLITAHSKAPAQSRLMDEYRVIGRAMQLVHDTPQIDAGFLTGSLASDGSPLKLQFVNLESEELAKVWNNTSKIIKPSFGVEISNIAVSSNRIREIGKRVASAEVRIGQSGKREGA